MTGYSKAFPALQQNCCGEFIVPATCSPCSTDVPAVPVCVCSHEPVLLPCELDGRQLAGFRYGVGQMLFATTKAIIAEIWRGRDAWAQPSLPFRAWSSGRYTATGLAQIRNDQAVTTRGGTYLVGVDYSPNEHWTLGALAGYNSVLDSWHESISEGRGRFTTGGLYLGWSEKVVEDARRGWFLHLCGYAGPYAGSIRRIPECGLCAVSPHSGSAVVLLFEGGYRTHYKGLDCQPFALFSKYHSSHHAFAEHGSDPSILLCAPKAGGRTWLLEPGFRFATSITSKHGIVTSPEVIINLAQFLTSPDNCIECGPCADDKALFVQCIRPYPWTLFEFAAGAKIIFWHHGSLHVRYSMAIGRGFHLGAATVQLSYDF